MDKSDVERVTATIVAGAAPIIRNDATGRVVEVRLSEHFPRLVNEAIRSVLIQHNQECRDKILKSLTWE